MTGLIRRYFADRPASLALGLVLAALLLRAVIPVGYMLNYGAISDGGPLIILCPEGIETVIENTILGEFVTAHTNHDMNAHDMNTEEATAGHASPSGPCVFMALAALTVLIALFLSLFPIRALKRRGLPPHITHVRNHAALGPISPRAPPAIA